MAMVKQRIGFRTFGRRFDIADPAHNKSLIWNRFNDVPIVPGNYELCVWVEDGENAILGAYLNGDVPEEDAMQVIGIVDTDTGMLGFFDNKPDMAPESYLQFRRKLQNNRQSWICPWGGICRTPKMENSYEVFGKSHTPGVYNAVEIRF